MLGILYSCPKKTNVSCFKTLGNVSLTLFCYALHRLFTHKQARCRVFGLFLPLLDICIYMVYDGGMQKRNLLLGLPSDLYYKMKAYSAIRKVSMVDVVIEALTLYLHDKT